MSALAALWLLGLWIAAPLLRGRVYRVADRLRDTLALGVAIPFVLGLAHALYPLALWLTLAACAVAGILRTRQTGDRAQPPEPVPYLTIAALALIAWPALVRPLLDGDSLAYHLPNAAAWANAHSLWTTNTLYWWYPPGSELFASGLFSVSGPFAVGWSGTLALALLGLRAADFARERLDATPLFADAAAAALVTIPPLALQGGTLQNDVWLAAFLLETLVTASGAASAVTMLLKPYGAALGVVGLVSKQAEWLQWLPAAAALGLWILHDELLRTGATVPISAVLVPHVWTTGIAANGFGAFVLFVRTLAALSPLALAAFFAALASPFFGKQRPVFAFAACASALWYLVMPFAFNNPLDQLANGASLRFAAPAIAFGVLAIVSLTRRSQPLFAALFAASAAAGALHVTAIFWNDATTRPAIAVAALLVGIAFAGARTKQPMLIPVALALAVVLASQLAARNPVAYLADAYARGDARTGLFAWVASHQPARAVTFGLRGGAVTLLAPRSIVTDFYDGEEPCAAARAARGVLIWMSEADRPALDAPRREAVTRCGAVLYQDPLAVVAQP